MLKVLLVDDEALARARLCTLLSQCSEPGAEVHAQAANAAQAVECLQRQSFDLALIDIHMPGADGLALARTLRTLPHPPAVVFVTAHHDYAVDAFELDAQDYLTKPVRFERLQGALQKVERLLSNSRALEPDLPENVIVIAERGRAERVPLAEVLYLKAELKYITVRTRARSYILEGSLNEFEVKYPERFIRVHRNALIARHAVRALEKHHDTEEGDGWAVRVHGTDELLFVSRRQLASVRELISG